MSQNTIRHEKQGRTHPRKVWFTGSTALVRGQGVCFDRDRGTAANEDGTRDNYVELPSTSNNRNFAGVVARPYDAVSGGQGIEIFEPGSVCKIAVGENTTVNATYLLCSAGPADAGRFARGGGMIGRGSALALQTTSKKLSSADDGGGALDSTGKIMTDAGKTFVTDGVVVGDTLVVVGGESDGTNVTTPGTYTITAVTETTITVGTAIADGGTMQITYYVISGNPVCQALLLDGPETGLYEFVQPKNNAASQSMVGGTTYIVGGVTLGAGDATATLANGTYIGERKRFNLLAALTTQDYLVTVTNGIQADGTTALASLELDGAGDDVILEWMGSNWQVVGLKGAAQA